MPGDLLRQVLAHLLDPRVGGDVEARHDVQQRSDILNQAVAERIDPTAGPGIDLEGAKAVDEAAGDLLHALPEIAIGVGNQFSVPRFDLGSYPRHLGVVQLHSEIVRLGNRHEVAAHGEFPVDLRRRWVVSRVKQPVQRRAGRFDVVRVGRHEIAHRAAESVFQRLLLGLIAEIVGGGQDAGAVVAPGQGVEVVVIAQRGVRGAHCSQQAARDQVLGIATHRAVGAMFRRDLVADADIMFTGGPDRNRQVDQHGRKREANQARAAPFATAHRVKAG